MTNLSAVKKIAVLTTGGDCPGLNAAIRAVVRTGNYYNLHVMGVMHGYDGLINNEFIDMPSGSVSNILQRGGTILKTARSQKFMTDEGKQMAFQNLQQHSIDALVVIGGDGSFRGAQAFHKMFPQIKLMGIPKTIDNDISGTDYAIGYDTAVNTVVDAIDKIRDTADSHSRLFFVEVMGRDAGMIALQTGIASGAEAILIPETKTKIERLVEILERGWQRKKSSFIIIVAEGDEEGGAQAIAEKVKQKFNYDTRVSVLGHIQRGGTPSGFDRVLAGRFGVAAVEALINGKSNLVTCIVHNEIKLIPFLDIHQEHKKGFEELLRISQILSS